MATDVDDGDILDVIMNRDRWALSTGQIASRLPGDPPRSTVAYRLDRLEKTGLITSDHIGTVRAWRRADEYIDSPRGVVIPAGKTKAHGGK